MDTDTNFAFIADDREVQRVLATAWQTIYRFDISSQESDDLYGFFRALHDLLAAVTSSDRIELVDSVMAHVDYLANKAGCSTAVILSGGSFILPHQIVAECLSHINVILETFLAREPIQPPDGIPADVFALILEAEATLAGWCSREKALTIARTVLQERPRTCVEIGIFGGRSLVPCAAALRHIGAGAIYGIEAWSPHVAIENVTNKVNDDWWAKVDFADIKREFYRFIAAANLTPHVRVIEAPSGRAASLFDEIDFLHIDGSHSVVNAAEDVILYARKVRSGGIVVFDDVNWQSTAPARDLLAALCDTVSVLKDPATGLDICAVLRRR